MSIKPSKTVSCPSCNNVMYLPADVSFKKHEDDCGCPGPRIVKINNSIRDLKNCKKKIQSVKRSP